jgi:hypothetical protein
LGLSLTWWSDSWSAVLPLESLPLALALATAELETVEAEDTLTVVAPVPTLRESRGVRGLAHGGHDDRRRHRRCRRRLPPRLRRGCFTVHGEIETGADLSRPRPQERGSRCRDGDGHTASRSDVATRLPFSACVVTMWAELAPMVRPEGVPPSAAESSTPARVVCAALFRAREAPTPTSVPEAPPLAVGFAVDMP